MPSSVEPARSAGHHTTGPPGPAPAATPGDASNRVIPFGRLPHPHRPRPPHPQPAQPERVVAPDSPEQRLAETAEAWLLARGATLTDDTTADTYRATLDLVQLMLDGSLAKNLIGEDEYRHLTGMMRGLKDAPDCV